MSGGQSGSRPSTGSKSSGRIRRGPWLQRHRHYPATWIEVIRREIGYTTARWWFCVQGLGEWFDVPSEATEIRVVIRRSSRESGDGNDSGNGNEYRVAGKDGSYLKLKTEHGSELVVVYWAVRNFVEKGDWLGLEWR